MLISSNMCTSAASRIVITNYRYPLLKLVSHKGLTGAEILHKYYIINTRLSNRPINFKTFPKLFDN